MNKNAIQKFAVWARTELIAQVTQRAYQYDITAESYGDYKAEAVGGRLLSDEEKKQRQELINQIRNKGYTQVMEEVAYTWFNRFIALRFMEVNNYLPTHVRVFSDASGAFKPEILNNVLHLDLAGLDMNKVSDLIDKNQTEDLYRYLLLTQCNALSASLPRMFEKMGSYTELLLPNNILRPDGILGRLVTDIPEEDWTDQVQIIGWLYQYYNTELKDETFALLKKNVKITKERIPSATQLFTPDWIVRYMVENSLGRLWLEGHPDDELKAGWKYYLDEAEQEPDVQKQLEAIRAEHCSLRPQDIRFIDPCMGSGHILVYAFDVLMQIYKSVGYNERDAAQSILENNLYGLDIDDRAVQLAYFAVMMKARQYDRRILTRGIQPHIYAPGIDPEIREYGSLLLVETLPEAVKDEQLSLLDESNEYKRLLTQKYHVLATNPPYMAVSNASNKVQEYVKKNFPDSKADLFAVFIERCRMLVKENGYQAMITQHAWMFLSSFEKLRSKMQMIDIVNMAHLGARAFEEIGGEVVQTTGFVVRQSHVTNYQGVYCRLIDPATQQGKETMFLSGDNRYTAKQSNFSKIPGSPVAYWVSENVENAFIIGTPITKYIDTFLGIITGDNDYFLRLWTELNYDTVALHNDNIESIDLSKQYWIPYNKGGRFRRWYGVQDYVINWKNGPEDKRRGKKDYSKYYLQEYVAWSYTISSSCNIIATRYYPKGFLWDVRGSGIFDKTGNLYYLAALISSKVGYSLFRVKSEVLSCQVENIEEIPVIMNNTKHKIIDGIVLECIDLSRADWDSFETSWDFKRHPLVRRMTTLEAAYTMWQQECEDRFNRLKFNEEEINRIFIDIYSLQNELSPEEDDKDVTVHRILDKKEEIPDNMKSSSYALTKRDVIVSLISYAVGCMFGRYSLDMPGLAYAGGEWDDSKYTTFQPDKDAIIPICDDEYFDDDIVGRFVKFIEAVYGKETLEENLKFIADALGGTGTTREVIRKYFLNDFYTDHLKTYQKRPIYWLFDSGRKNGFKALVYMHRYQSDLLARLRTDYVHEQQERYRTQLKHIGDAMDSASASERVKLIKQQKKLQEQALELQKYEEKVHHLADQNIKIDLDDGVKVNYAKFEDVLAKIK